MVAQSTALGLIGRTVTQQATLLAYIDVILGIRDGRAAVGAPCAHLVAGSSASTSRKPRGPLRSLPQSLQYLQPPGRNAPNFTVSASRLTRC